MYNEILNKLKNFPPFRERRFRIKYLSILALRACGLGHYIKDNGLNKRLLKLLTLEELADFASSYTSYDRIWRLVLSEHKELQGEDYLDKQIVEQEKQIELGYEQNYQNNVKMLDRI